MCEFKLLVHKKVYVSVLNVFCMRASTLLKKCKGRNKKGRILACAYNKMEIVFVQLSIKNEKEVKKCV